MNRTAGKNVLLAAPQLRQHEIGISCYLPVRAFLDFNVRDTPAHARLRVLRDRVSAAEPLDARLEPRTVVVDRRDVRRWTDIVVGGRPPVERVVRPQREPLSVSVL